MKKDLKAVTLGAIIAAISVILSFGGQFFAVAKFAGPLIAGIILILQRELFGIKQALAVWFASSALMLLLIQEKTGVFAYIALLGYYPCMHIELYRIKNRFINFFVKFLWLTVVGVTILFLGINFFTDFNFVDISKQYLIIIAVVLYYMFFLFFDLFLYYLYHLCFKEWIAKLKKFF